MIFNSLLAGIMVRTYLLTIPNPTRAFSMADPELRATNEAKAWIEMNKPDFKKRY